MTLRRILILAIVVTAWAAITVAQSPPDAPSAVHQPSVAAGCGPSWLGGCYDVHVPQLGWTETLKSRRFLAPTLTLTAFTAWDYATTAYFSRNGHSLGNPAAPACSERNAYLGQRPGPTDFAKDFATTHLPVIAFGYFLTRRRVPHWIYDSMAGYGIVIHARGAISWYQNCW